jgi:hypothetical protein
LLLCLWTKKAPERCMFPGTCRMEPSPRNPRWCAGGHGLGCVVWSLWWFP